MIKNMAMVRVVLRDGLVRSRVAAAAERTGVGAVVCAGVAANVGANGVRADVVAAVVRASSS